MVLSKCMLTFLLDNIFIRFGTKLYRHVDGFLWALIVLPWLQKLFLFRYEIDFMMFLSDDKQVDIIEVTTLHPDIWMIF